MARETFIDTSGFYALLVRNDGRHKEARAWLERAEAARQRAVTTDDVLDETATLMKAKGARASAPGFLRARGGIGGHPHRVDGTGAFQPGQGILPAHHDHEYSFTDCVSFVVMKEFSLREALSKDRHFQEAGFQPLLLE